MIKARIKSINCLVDIQLGMFIEDCKTSKTFKGMWEKLKTRNPKGIRASPHFCFLVCFLNMAMRKLRQSEPANCGAKLKTKNLRS